MGTALALVSSLGLLFWLLVALAHLINPTWFLGFEEKEDLNYFEQFMEEDAPDPKVANDNELKNHFETHFAKAKSDLPDGVTKEIYTNTMFYFTKLRAGEVIQGFMLTDDLIEMEPKTDRLPDTNSGWDFDNLSGGMTADTTVRELILKDRAFFETHKAIYQLLVVITAIFFATVSFVILRMALSWRRGDPFGPGTIRGLRQLGVLFLAQFLAAFAVVLIIPESGFTELTSHSMLFEDLATGFGSGASLSCGIVFLTLSWVIEYGRKMREEQALTI